MPISKGDKVAVLDEAFEGIVTAVNQDRITIETTDGFEMTYFVNELIKINNSNNLSKEMGSFSFNSVNKEKEQNISRKSLPQFKIKGEIPAPEFDLHIEKLVKNYRGMSNFDILNTQLETAQRHIDFAIRNRIPKIVLIHGVGDGVLKNELNFLLNRLDGISFGEANYQKYGQGATEVYFVQNRK